MADEDKPPDETPKPSKPLKPSKPRSRRALAKKAPESPPESEAVQEPEATPEAVEPDETPEAMQLSVGAPHIEQQDVQINPLSTVTGTGTPPTSPNFAVPRFSAGDPADGPTQMNAITDTFDGLAAKRGSIVDADIASNAAINQAKLALATGMLPNVADVKMTAAATPPAGWLMCDGSPVSRTTYAALFAAIGLTYGAGNNDGITFSLPNLQGRVPVGANATYARGTAGGEANHLLTAAESGVGSHAHQAHGVAGNGRSQTSGVPRRSLRLRRRYGRERAGQSDPQRCCGCLERPQQHAAVPAGQLCDQVLMPYPETPHFAFPFARDPTTGSVKVVEQDTIEHIMGCETVIVSYPVGLREDRPEFGWPWPDLTNVPIDLGGLEQALRQFEPRGTATATQYLDAIEAARVHVNVEVGIPSVDMQHTPVTTNGDM